MTMKWRAFKLLNASERAWLERAVRPAVADWLAAWLPVAELRGVRCVDAGERTSTRLRDEPPRWIGCANRDAALSIAVDRDIRRPLADAMFGTDVASELLDDVLAAALGDLGQRLLGASAAEPAALSSRAPSASCWQRGSGAAIVEVDIAGGSLALVGATGWVAQQLASRPRTAPGGRAAPLDPRQCIGHGGVQLQAWAGGVSIELGLLQTLAIGDVIRLDSRVDQPLRVTVQGRETGRSAYLGSVEGLRAVQLAPPR